jgi:hypothetical protein
MKHNPEWLKFMNLNSFLLIVVGLNPAKYHNFFQGKETTQLWKIDGSTLVPYLIVAEMQMEVTVVFSYTSLAEASPYDLL